MSLLAIYHMVLKSLKGLFMLQLTKVNWRLPSCAAKSSEKQD